MFLLVNSGPIEIQNKRFGAQLFLLEMAALEIFETKGMFCMDFSSNLDMDTWGMLHIGDLALDVLEGTKTTITHSMGFPL